MTVHRERPLRCTTDGHAPRPLVITFSGIDGAGKTTQIERLCADLEAQGHNVGRFVFWDDVACFAGVRAGVGDNAARSRVSDEDGGLVAKNSKHLGSWYLTIARSAMYLFDALKLRRLMERIAEGRYDFVIFDRYIYDQLVILSSRGFLTKAYIRIVLGLSPKPDLAFVLDAPAEDAFIRKPEYPLHFMYSYRRAFLRFRETQPNLIVVPSSTMDEVAELILRHVQEQIVGDSQATLNPALETPSIPVV
jgi:thymidylate kinase